MLYSVLSNLSIVIVGGVVLSLGITAIAVFWTKYQVKELQEKLLEKELLSEDEKLLLEITKEYLEKVK